MNLEQCMKNLSHDVGNGGVEEDTFSAICYITMANKARCLLKSNVSDPQAADRARKYLALCCRSGVDSLRCAVEG